MRITVLMENTGPGALRREHGLSLYVAHENTRLLLDAGASGLFADNAAALGIDLAQVNAAVLSHGHFDHGDGFGSFLALNAHAPVYARTAVTDPAYIDTAEGGRRFIGVNPDLLTRYQARFDLADGPRRIAPGLHLIPDGFAHEQSLVAETARGLVVLNPCCHAGAGYLIKDILARFSGKRVHALVGGLHLMGRDGTQSLGVSPGIVKNLARWLTAELGVDYIYTGHCTGAPAFSLLQAEAGDRVRPLTTGQIIAFT